MKFQVGQDEKCSPYAPDCIAAHIFSANVEYALDLESSYKIVVFMSFSDFDLFTEHVSLRPFRDTMLAVQQVALPDCVKVCNESNMFEHETLNIVFTRQRIMQWY